MTTAVSAKPKPETANEKEVSFIPFGASDKIRLTASMVRQFIAVPTRSGALPNEAQCIKFIMLCRGKRANPFESDCYMIGYDTQNGPCFSMVCGIELFLKRSEQSVQYDGRESGVIVANSENVLTERPGAMVLKGEKLVGGWAKVYRKDKTYPEYKSVAFDVYNTGKSRWQADPGGMIEKVALSQALRSAYPTALGGLYTQEEMQRLTETGQGLLQEAPLPISMPRSTDAPPDKTPSKPTGRQYESVNDLADGEGISNEVKEKITDDPPSDTRTVQVKLSEFLADAGVSVDDALSFMQTKGLVKDASSLGGYDDLPDDVCAKLAGDSKMLAELTKKFGKSAA